MFVQACQALAGLEGFLDLPPPPGDPHVVGQGDRFGAVAAVIGQLTGLVVTAYQQMVVASCVVDDVEQCPRVPAWPLAPVPR